MRLNRFLSSAGVCSRRKADEYIEKGYVKVNNKIVKELGITINPDEDIVEFRGRIVKAQKPVYIMLNKPCCYLTSLGEKEEKPTIRELIKDVGVRVYPAGRLDYNVEGLLIITNDGELANRIIHPRYKLPKVYIATVKGEIDDETLEKMKMGVKLEDGFVKPDSLKLLKRFKNGANIEITFHEGKNHLVKRFFLAFKKPVKHLIRTAIGPISLGNLPKGKWRHLKPNEVKLLFEALHYKPTL
jgi:23S rRNA pseudouridine2605 synthase